MNDEDLAARAAILNRIIGETWTFRASDDGEGMFAVDPGGLVMTRGQLVNIYSEMMKFYDREGISDAIEEVNLRREEYFRRNSIEIPRSMNRQLDGVIYLIEGPDGLFKIGKTRRPADQRMADFSPKLPFDITLVAQLSVEDVNAEEARIHGILDANRVRGEWFKLDPQQVEWFKAGAK